MKRDFLIEWILYISVRILSLFFMILPLGLGLFLGKSLGVLAYYLDRKHRSIVYSNLKIVFSNKFSPQQLCRITKRVFLNLGQNLVEILCMPKLNTRYINKYIQFEGENYLKEAQAASRGAVLLGAHFGNWELCFAVAPLLGNKLSVFVEEQLRFRKLGELLNSYRQMKGCGVIAGEENIKEIIRRLKNNEFILLVADHGAREGIYATFFGRRTLAPTGAIRLALKFDVPVLPVYIRRLNGPRHKIFIGPPIDLDNSGDLESDLPSNLEKVNRILEGYIGKWPEQYLWFYKRFKYSQEKSILVLSDGKLGHTRQLEAIVKIIKDVAKEKKLSINISEIEVKFKNRLSKGLMPISVCLANPSDCQGCLWCLRSFLKEEVYGQLVLKYADIVLSCGASLAAINFVIASQSQAKSIVLMRPGALSTQRFSLVVMPRHDNPPHRPNIVATSGTPNLIDEEYLTSCVLRLKPEVQISKELAIGLLVGGNTKRFTLSKEKMGIVIEQLLRICNELDGEILTTTSRRTPKEVENLIKERLHNYQRSRLLIIANENNLPGAIGGILGLAKFAVVSGDSVSMVSEAAASGRYVIVFESQLKKKSKTKHDRFLSDLENNGYISLVEPEDIYSVIKKLWQLRPPIKVLKDTLLVRKAIEKVI